MSLLPLPLFVPPPPEVPSLPPSPPAASEDGATHANLYRSQAFSTTTSKGLSSSCASRSQLSVMFLSQRVRMSSRPKQSIRFRLQAVTAGNLSYGELDNKVHHSFPHSHFSIFLY